MRERLSERVRQFRAKARPILSNGSVVIVLLMLVASGVAVSQTTAVTYDFEEYAVGTEAPGPWSDGTVSNESFYGERSLNVAGDENAVSGEVDVNLTEVQMRGTMQTNGISDLIVDNGTTTGNDLIVRFYEDEIGLTVNGNFNGGSNFMQPGVWYDFQVYTNSTHTVLELHESSDESQSTTFAVADTPTAPNASGVLLDTGSSASEGSYDNVTFNSLQQVDNGGGEAQEDAELELDTRDYIQPNTSAPYSVHFNDSGSWSEVTENATVTSDNTSVIAVNAAENLLEGQAGVNTTVNVTANYTASDGTVYTTTKQITVAQATVENLEILPAIWRFGATFGDDTIFFLIVATLTSIVATRFSTAFGGLSLYWVVIMLGWFSGWVSLGILLLATVMCMFIGLNLAANINYGAVGSFRAGR